MRIAICDDETGALGELSALVGEWAVSRDVETELKDYPGAEAFLMAWSDVPFDLVFLDIRMKGMMGTELAETIRKTDKGMMIVFVTGYIEYVLDGYEVNALHYLIKPLSFGKLAPVLDKAYARLCARQNDAAFAVDDGSGLRKLYFDEIYYIEMLSHQARIYTGDGAYALRRTAEELLCSLPEYIVRCHRSYIVNLLRVERIYKASLHLADGRTVPLSRSQSANVTGAFLRINTR